MAHHHHGLGAVSVQTRQVPGEGHVESPVQPVCDPPVAAPKRPTSHRSGQHVKIAAFRFLIRLLTFAVSTGINVPLLYENGAAHQL
jgi:hypothetical protein